MSKKEFIDALSCKTQMTKKDCAIVLEAFQDVVKEEVAKGNTIQIPGFLTFEKKHVPAKSGVTRLGGVEKPWSTPEKDEVSVKLSKSYKSIEE